MHVYRHFLCFIQIIRYSKNMNKEKVKQTDSIKQKINSAFFHEGPLTLMFWKVIATK